jgi:hypothetical protein
MSTRNSVLSLLVMFLLGMSIIAVAQAPTGIITGTVSDESGAVIPNATVSMTNKATGAARTAITNAEGLYSAPSMEAGEYEVRVEVQGFKTTVRAATVQAGGVITVNMAMSLGATKDVVTVEAASAQINYENGQIQGVVGRTDIQELPLNGRSFLQLAQLEPGVTISTGTPAQFNALFTVSTLGTGTRTVITIDGGNVSDNVTTGGGMTSMNFSQDSVQEFQLSEVNFDLATPIAAGGAINVVTRSGSNDWHGSAYFFYRDHNMAAYPNLQRDPLHPSPFFDRKDPGATIGGPIIRNKLFFFFNYEYQTQVQALSIETTSPYLLPLEGTYGSPYSGKTLSLRFDYHLNDKNNLFLRYSHDGNTGFGQALIGGDPSSWARNINWSDQSIIGWTSTITPTLVNDLRFQYNYWSNGNLQADASACSSPCVAGSLPTIYTFIGSNYPAVGPNFDAPQARTTRRYETVESLSWQKGNHRFKFGADLNPTRTTGLWGFCTPMCVGAFAPDDLVGIFGKAVAPLLFPSAFLPFTSDASALNLPVYNGAASIFSGVGVGADATPAPYGRGPNAWANQYRAYFQDTWKITPHFTLNYGLGWDAQVGFYNSNLSKPQFLAPIFGQSNLGPTQNNTKEFQPAFGFAWSPFKDNKTVIRGGAGIYWDSTPYYYKLREAPVIGPLGDGRDTLAASAFTNNIPGLISFAGPGPCPIPGFPSSACSLVPVGAPLPIGGLTTMTVGQFQNLVNQELPAIAAKLFPSNVQTSGPYCATCTGIDVLKQGVEVYPEHFPLARSYQTSVGVQRELPMGMVLTADWARRQAENYSLGEQDYNHYNLKVNGALSPVIPVCTSAQLFVPGQECSTGAITVWTDQGRSVYDALLVKVVKRLSNHTQFTASYALQKGLDENPYDYMNYMSSYGQYLPHHNLNIAGLVTMPWGFQLSLNSSIISRSPVTANVAGLVLPGTDPSGSSEPLPGLKFGCLNAGCGKGDLAAALNAYNSANGTSLALPSNYALSAPTFSQDIRLTKTFVLKERYKFAVLGEMFNALNISNLTIGSYTIGPSFGQPTGRVTQTFGSGGPRALQVGARFTF